MSVAIPVVDTWDGPNRRIYLKLGVTSFHPVTDIYAEYRNQRRISEAFRRWEPFMIAEGNVSKGGGKFTPRYVKLLSGCKIVPPDQDIENGLDITGEVFTDDQTSPFDFTLIGVSTKMILEYKPPEAEVIQAGSGLDTTQDTKLEKIYAAHFYRRVCDKSTQKIRLYQADGTTVLAEFDTNTNLTEINPL